MSKYPKKVLVFGGTHGNEWTGVTVVRHYADYFKRKFPQLELDFIWANPEAYKVNSRFKDEDLNRAFQFLNESRPDSYEHKRASEIKKLIDESPCYVIDLHTTTSAMGKTLILTDYDPLNLHLSSRVAKKFSDARIIGSPDPDKKYLASQTKHSLMIEVGAVANSLVDPIVLEGTLSLLEEILSGLSDVPTKIEGELELYEEILNIDYPTDDQNEIEGYIHPDFQGRDFHPVRGEYVPFRTFKGADVRMSCEEEFYPIFINEAAYYPQKMAYTLCRKRELKF